MKDVISFNGSSSIQLVHLIENWKITNELLLLKVSLEESELIKFVFTTLLHACLVLLDKLLWLNFGLQQETVFFNFVGNTSVLYFDQYQRGNTEC